MIENLVRRFLYYPEALPPAAPLPSYIRGAEEVFLKADDGNTVHGLYWTAPTDRPTVLFLHGNAQTVFEWALVREELAPLECGMLLIDYPGYGKSTGTPSETSNYAAGRAALNYLLFTKNLAEREIVLFGKSLGGGVVTEIAVGLDLHGVILESTFTSIPAVARRLLPMLPADALFKSEVYRSVAKIKDTHAPVLVIHGEADELIPVSEGKALFEAAGEPKRLYLVPDAGHNDVAYTAGPAYARTIREWLDEVADL